MPTSEILLMLFCLLGALQGLLLGVAVATLGEGPRRANRLLSLILLGGAAVLVVILLSHRRGIGAAAAALELTEYSMWLFAGPVVYAYVSLAVSADRAPIWRLLPHLAPGVGWLSYAALIQVGAIGGAIWLPPVSWMLLYQMLYTALAIWRWRRGARRGPPAGIHALSVQALVFVLLIQHAAQLVRWQWRTVEALRDVVPWVGAASFVAITFLGLRRALPLVGRARSRYAGSTLGAQRARRVAARLTDLLERERPYLRPDLTLEELASELGVPRTHLSQVVNQRFGQSLPDLLAGYRLRESERLLADGSVAHLTIAAIARRSGFNSRSVFYEAFRRQHGITPSAYRRRAAAPAPSDRP